MEIFTVSSERRACFKTECIINDPEHTVIMTLQGHPMSLILAPIESSYMTSYSISIVDLIN